MTASKAPQDDPIANSIELNNQQFLVNIFMILALPALLFFMVHDFLTGQYIAGLILFLMVLIIVFLFIFSKKSKNKTKKMVNFRYFLTVLFILFGTYLVYEIGIEGDVSRIPWSYIFPVLVFFALGEGRALVWVSILFAALLFFGQFFPSHEHIEIQELKTRFYLSFLLVIMASYFFERLKRKYRYELIQNQKTLKESENRYREAYEQLDNEMKERRRAEVALRESEERFRELAELLPETIYEMDLDGNLVFVNRNAFDHFGFTQEDFDNGLNSFEMIAPEDRERAKQNTENILNGKNIGLNEYTAQRKDGSTFPAITHSAPIVRAGKPAGLRGFIIDISERKQAEEERRQLEFQFQRAQRMEAIGTLAGGIAHDFNNLLTTIQGNASLLLYDIEPSHPHFESLRKIEKQVQRGAELTSQLLGYARKGKYQAKTVNLNQVVADNCETFARARKEITIHLDLAPHMVSVEADLGQIEQILLNLFVNAADAMPDGGSLNLKTDNVTHLDIKGKHFVPVPGNYVRLAVTDTGMGMDPKVQERIFEPFFTTKEMGRGSGLGLASVYGIIKNHDGYIEVESDPGKGTTFSIYLPASDKQILQSAEASTGISKGSETILIIDDEEAVLEIGASILKKLGYTVIQAANAADAIERFQKNHPTIDMVILDMILPTISGGAIYDRLKEIDPSVKVLLSSGYSIDGQATEILKRGCDGFIQKPFSIKSLSEKIKSILVKV